MSPRSSQRHLERFKILKPLTKTLICWKMSLSRRIWVSPTILHRNSLLFGWRSYTSAGADTTASAIGTFFLAMVCYPEAQKKAQAELDEVLNGRLPEHSDFPSLPYISALVKEIYRYAAVCFEYPLLHVNCVSRWNPVFPLGRSLLLHFSNMTVTSWHPYLFKPSRTSRSSRTAMISTTTIISPPILLWSLTYGDSYLLRFNFKLFLVSQTLFHRAMLNDERVYPEPLEFKPERYLKNGKLDSSVRDPMDIAFGFGRRWALHYKSMSLRLLSESSPFL